MSRISFLPSIYYSSYISESLAMQPSQLAEMLPKDSFTICFLSSTVVSFIKMLLNSMIVTSVFRLDLIAISIKSIT